MCTLSKRGRGRRQEEEQHVSSGDVEARGVKERKLCFLLYPLAGRVKQTLHPLFLFFSFISFAFLPTLLSFDTSVPVEASTGSRNDNVKDHQAHQHNDNSQLEVLHAHGSCQVTTCGLECDR